MKQTYEKKYVSKIPQEYYPQESEAQYEALKGSAQLKEFAEYRQEMKDHPYMPSYHFWAPTGKINDPNGLCYWNGNYHLFYQAYPPNDPRQHWGHTVSSDMVHWKDLPLAIYPDIEYAVFSGSSLVENDRVIAMYHGRGIGNMIATSHDPMLLNWEKNEHCPVIPLTPNSSDGRPYRVFDPFIWKEDEGYYALSGCYYGEEEARHTGYNNKMVEHLFFSQDLSRWTYMGELTEDGFPQLELGNDGACPYFWPIGTEGKYLLFHFSHRTGPHCLLGTYDKILHKFYPEKHMRFNFGPIGCSSYQAPCTTPDGKGGLYLIYNTTDANLTLTRQGCMTVMHHVIVNKKGYLNIEPVEALNSLHTSHFSCHSLNLAAFRETILDVNGNALDIHLTLDLTSARGLTLRVLRSPDGMEHTDITVNRSRMRRGDSIVSEYYLIADTTRSSLSPDAEGRNPEVMNIPDVEESHLDLRILVDRCMVEIFANGRITMMQMMYPSKDSTQVSLEALGGNITINSLDIWNMASIY